MNKVIGFIGAGNMGQAMVGGIVNSKLVVPENIILSDLNEKALEAAKEKFGVGVTTDSNELAKEVDILVLSVKPNLYPMVIKGIKDSVKKDVIVVTIAAGKALEDTENMFGKRIKIVRVMPNTPALVGEGMAAICPNDLVSKEETEEVISIFESFGKAEIVGEKLMDAVTAVSGSSPAYVYMFIEAMADAAVLEGMPRDKAYKFAAQAVLGSAKMVLETGMHPGALKDMVCSPGGTTIEAVATLEKQGFRNAIIEAMRDCAIKSKEMSK
ncbi:MULTISPECIES: pyrroline-5-carboxylate reductase [Clostridium]|uniref:Pyrroline-5-carboxylate reductase n=2 Tax=Clostridium sporogenes TaxID=1509 RepID=A0A7X5PEV7_CLOSG|nr:pyrroline-5-carboxylate reductase [Clostridium sporogenes]AJD30558.1 pyrroline-5-carboxylate reductase [Clostridium botulinum Prevot_594]AVP62315.1 pyrroline-5-carboxylate reductase [Clostridium botulinum]AKC63998.1 pyrroline-5-carboxylate reductase ProC [Clostridium sporogenes]AKJ91137.1 pyrroline-5-carboxylate reductase [Clostridium sporogenes]KCZ66912.1 pyrroline-5-carboxylate reductase ProC [Clostridium sporogenes]